MKNLFLLISIFLAPVMTFAGTDAKKKFETADGFFTQENYARALPLYLDVAKEVDNANINFLIGVCYLNSTTEKQKAQQYLEKASASISEKYKYGKFKEKNAPRETWLYLGKAQHLNYKFDEAIASFEKFLSFLSENQTVLREEVFRGIELAKNGKEYYTNPVNIKVDNVGSNINSPYSEHSPVLSADEETFIFTSRRPGTTGEKKDPSDDMFFEDIYISTKTADGWSAPVNMGSPINTDGHDATIGISVDGQRLLIFKDDNGDGNIYESTLVGNKWSSPKKLNENINTKSWEAGACFSADGNALYFVSDREGGFGGKDIYRSVKLPNGEWSKPLNLGPAVNTKYDEEGPFFHPDGKTLYFSTSGHKSFGGMDIFTTTLSEDGSWTPPVNMGYPVNSTDDDVFYIPTPDNKRGYYSSFKNDGGFGEKDIYMLTYPDAEEANLTVYRGEMLSIYGGVPEGAFINVTDNETGELIGSYTPNAQTGKYLIILQPGKNYNISYEAEGFLFQSENLNVTDSSVYQLINRPIELNPIKVGTRMTLKNIFFASGQSTLSPSSRVELEKLKELMTKLPNLVVEIEGHTDSKGSEQLNQRLSQQRAESVVKYLVDGGIAPARLKAIGYGESRPIARNENADGSDNKAGMSLNRRFEFVIIGVNGHEKDAVEKIQVPEELKPKQGGK